MNGAIIGNDANEHEAYTRLMLDSMPMICLVWAESGELVDCNAEVARVFGVSYKADFIERFDSFIPSYQADGSLSAEKHAALLEHAFQTGFQEFEWEFESSSGSRIPVSAIMLRVPWGRTYRVLCFAYDLRDIKRSQDELMRHSQLLQATNTIVQNLTDVTAEEMRAIMATQLGILGSAIGTNHVHLWENRCFDGKHYSRTIFEWPTAIGRAKSKRRSNTFAHEKTPAMIASLMSGESVSIKTEQLWTGEDSVSGSASSSEYFCIPLFYEHKFWGIIGLESSAGARSISDAEEKLVRSCGFIIVSAIMRGRTLEALIKSKQELTYQKELLTAVNKVATLLLTNHGGDLHELTHDCLQVLGECLGASRVSFWRVYNISGTLYMQRYKEWVDRSIALSAENNGLLVLAESFPQWSGHDPTFPDIDLPIYRMSRQVQLLRHMKNMKSILLISVFLDGSFWGFLGVDNPNAARRFSSEERDILRTAGLNIAIAIANRDIKTNLAVVQSDASLALQAAQPQSADPASEMP